MNWCKSVGRNGILWSYRSKVGLMKHKTKRPLSKRTRVLLLALACAAALCMLWGFAVEPLQLTVSEVEFADSRLPKEMDGTRVVLLTDIHVGPFYSERDVERVMDKVAELKADMVLFGGDLMPKTSNYKQVDGERVSRALAGLKPRLGKYAVLGNHDIRTADIQQTAISILESGGFQLLQNDAKKIGPGFYLCGTGSASDDGPGSPTDQADVSKVAWTTEHNAFSLLLSHEPSQTDANAQYPFALQLSGHTHGGQISLPLIGPFLLYGHEDYFAGFYTVGQTRLYVSRGIGTSVVRARFLAPPEIVVVTLRKSPTPPEENTP